MNKKQLMASKMPKEKEPSWKARSGLKTKKAFTKLLASKDYKRDFTNIDEYHER